MTEEDVIRFISGLPGVEAVTASEANAAPEVSWGDTFFFYDPDGDIRTDRRFPFATILTKDYPGFDTASGLDRPGVFRSTSPSAGAPTTTCSGTHQPNTPTTTPTTTTPP